MTMGSAFVVVGKLLVIGHLFVAADGVSFEYDASVRKKVINDADHRWDFDEASSLYSIVDRVSRTKANIREGGAKLTRHDVSTNNFLTLEGRSSSIELGRFGKCIGVLPICSDGFTFSLWLRLRDTVGEEQDILGISRSSFYNTGFSLIRTEKNEMKVVVLDSATRTYLWYASSLRKWDHHLVTWDSGKMSVFINGKKLLTRRIVSEKRHVVSKKLEGFESLGTGYDFSGSTGLLSLGRHGFKIDADYDNLMFWNRKLNDTEAVLMYYGDLDDPVITGCSSVASSVCVKWKLPNDAFDRINEVTLTYQYLHQTYTPVEVRLNSTARETCIGLLGSLTTYFFRVNAYFKHRSIALRSKTITCKTTDGIPNAPSLSVGDKTSTSIEVIWLTPSPANGAIIAYSVTVKETKTGSIKVELKMNAHNVIPGRIGTYKLNITSLIAGMMYEINVKAISLVGHSSESSVTSTTKGIPLPDTDSSTVRITNGKVRIGWPAVNYAVSYRLHVAPINKNGTSIDVLTNSAEFASLRPSTLYIINVRPVFGWGLGSIFIKNLNVRTPGWKIVPSDINVLVMGWDKVLVNWTSLTNKDAVYIVVLTSANNRQLSRETKRNQVMFDNVRPLTTYTVYIQTKFKWGLGPKAYVSRVVTTEDMNECKQMTGNRCHTNADCFNVEASYLCQCKKDFVGDGFNCRPMPKIARRMGFCEENIFRDVTWPKIFNGGVAVRRCPNGTVGFASRKCYYDVSSQSSVYEIPNLSDCVSEDVISFGEMVDDPKVSAIAVEEQLIRVTTAEKLYGGDVRKTVDFYNKFIGKRLKGNALVQNMSQSLLNAAGNLLNESVLAAWEDLPKIDRSEGATKLFNGLETLAQKLFIGYSRSFFRETFSTSNIDMELQRVENPKEKLEYIEPNSEVSSAGKSQISLPTKDIMSLQGEKKADVVYFTYTNLDKILGIAKSPSPNSHVTSMDILNSKVVSAVVVGAKKVAFQSPVVLVLPHLKETHVLNTSCVFWNISKSPQSKWLNTGCYVNYTDVDKTVCHCYHLTNFAVLMTVSTVPSLSLIQGHHFALRIITIIGLVISIIAMLVAFITFCCFRFLRNARTTYHAHLVASLILADLLFLFGIDKTSNKVACSVIAVLLHYFFTVAFVWMAMEGVLLYFMLKKIFRSRNFFKRKRCYILCWALPAVYVALLGILKIEHYGNSSFCWLSRKEGFVWSFVAPVSLTLVVNFTVMGFAFQVMSEKRNKGPDDGTFSDVWYWLKGLLVLSCLLGVTWILGVFYVDADTIGFAYVFTLLNAMQGLFIFIFHCFIDSRVRSEYLRLIKCQKRSDYNEKAGYSSSMKFRKLSGSIKSLGSLDRSLSHSSGKRTLSNSLDRTLLRQQNDSMCKSGRSTIIKSTPSSRSEINDGQQEDMPEMRPLVQKSFSEENEGQATQERENPSNGLRLHDEKDGSSYSSVFEPESEQMHSQVLNVRDAIGIVDPVIDASNRGWNDPIHGSDSGVSVHSVALQGESFDSNPVQSNQTSFEEPKIEKAETEKELESLQKSVSAAVLLLNAEVSANVEGIQIHESSESLKIEEEATKPKALPLTEAGGVHPGSVCRLVRAPSKEKADEPMLTVEVIRDKIEMPIDILYEESQTSRIVEDRPFSMHFDKLKDPSSDAVEGCCEAVYDEAGGLPHISSIQMSRMIQFEVESLPEVKAYESTARYGSPDKRERVETSLRISAPRLISVSSIESEPISPIIISINPENKEFSMLEAEIEFSDDALSTYSET